MSQGYLLLKKSPQLRGQISLVGAKNAVLGMMASLILTNGTSYLENVPNSADVHQMIKLLQALGAHVAFDIDQKQLKVDTSTINCFEVSPDIMNKMRASILVLGPLLARFGKARVALPGGCVLGARPINYHLSGMRKMGVEIDAQGYFLHAQLSAAMQKSHSARIVLEYPSVGATENLMMLAVALPGETTIINAAMEPEVLDIIDILKKMGAQITLEGSCTIHIRGVGQLNPVSHHVIPDRLEAGALLLAASITGGEIYIPDARPDHMDLFLEKLQEMGHLITTRFNSTDPSWQGIKLVATKNPRAVSFKTAPYPGFPTDLQAPMMAALCLANGSSVIEETVFENRLIHAQELRKMGAQIGVQGTTATIHGVDALYGCDVIANDIRASCSLVMAGLNATGQTKVTGIHHWQRGYDKLEEKLRLLGAPIELSI